jgi:hypothetical protein
MKSEMEALQDIKPNKIHMSQIIFGYLITILFIQGLNK